LRRDRTPRPAVVSPDPDEGGQNVYIGGGLLTLIIIILILVWLF
jgi:hypothetical protein